MKKQTRKKNLSVKNKHIKKVASVYKKVHKRFRIFFKSFTIAELLIVLVVIGILSLITYATYSGIHKRAVVASIRTELSDISKQLKIFQTINDSYPSTIDCSKPDDSNNLCLPTFSDESQFEYYARNDSKQIFCITSIKNDFRYNINHDGDVLAGPCPIIDLSANNSVSYNGVGNTWYDISGNENDGKVNGPKYSVENGGVLVFDGVDDYVETDYIEDTDSNQITVAAWIRPGSTNGIYEISNQGEWTTGPWVGWRFRQIGKELDFSLSDESSNVYECSGGGLTAEAWQYVVGLYNGEYIALFINGQEAAKCQESIDYSGNKGEHSIGKYDGSSYYFNGMIGSISIYNKALMLSEIVENYNITKVFYGF